MNKGIVQELEEKEKVISAKNTKICDFEKELKRQDEAISNTVKELEILEEGRMVCMENNRRLEEENLRLLKEVQEKQTIITVKTDKINDFQRELKSQGEAISNSSKKLEKLEEDRRVHIEKKQELEVEIDGLLKKLNEEQKAADGKDAEMKVLIGDLKASKENAAKISIKFQSSCENVNDLLKEVKHLNGELLGKMEEVECLNVKLGEKEEDTKLLIEETQRIRDQNIQMKNQVKAKQNQVENTDYSGFRDELNNFKKDILTQVSLALKQVHNKNEPSTPKSTKQRKQKHKKSKKNGLEKGLTVPNKQKSISLSPISSSIDVSCDENSCSDTESENEDQSIVVVPGYLQYNQVVNKESIENRQRKTLIISTSITRDVNVERFNQCYHDGEAHFRQFRGGKTKHIKEEVEKTMNHGEFDSTLIHIGGNDLQDLYLPELIPRLATKIIDLGLSCRKQGADTVFISGVTVRKYEYTWERCRLLNQQLKEMCTQNNFIFVDNSNVNYVDHLCDKVHLNTAGTAILANNYLGSFKKAFYGRNIR